MPKQLPSLAVQSRWFSEPLKVLVLPERTFVLNKHSQPVLTKGHQVVLSRYMRLRSPPWLLLNDVGPIPTSAASEYGPPQPSVDPTPQESSTVPSQKLSRSVFQDPTPHLSYVRALQRKQPPKPPTERFGAGYQDYLQMPLQPLADNLESITYEVFEKDPIKYEWYERAISDALLDWNEENKMTSSPTGAVVIAVVGAGRGPLVTRALHAAEIAGIDVEVWAVEKNPNAYVLLQRHNIEAWNHRVNIVKTDMRAWKGPLLPDGTNGKVDIIVSELLGSFADNELSPECLDGVQHVLNPDHGISIPSSYTAFLTPIATPKIYTDILGKALSDDGAFEVPYVVMLHAYDYLSYEPKASSNSDSQGSESPPLLSDLASIAKTPVVLPCWTFNHPLPPPIITQSSLRRGGSAISGGGGPTGGDGANAHNTRFAQLTFKRPRRGVCHGFAGYFETVLYAGMDEESRVELSTNPLTMDRMSRDMISWFPIYFPVKVRFAAVAFVLA
jgi:type II protein arginine methyltransferase